MQSTLMKKHWAVDNTDNTITQKIEDTEEGQIIDFVIKTNVGKRLSELDSKDSKSSIPSLDIDLTSKSLKDESKANFEIPYLERNYTIGDKKKIFSNSQRWVGHILEIQKDSFVAKLNDLNNPTTFEIGEFETSDVSPEDKEFISIGSAFYWSIGQGMFNGQVEKKSIIRFQRAVPWDYSFIDKIVDRTDQLLNNLNWD